MRELMHGEHAFIVKMLGLPETFNHRRVHSYSDDFGIVISHQGLQLAFAFGKEIEMKTKEKNWTEKNYTEFSFPSSIHNKSPALYE